MEYGRLLAAVATMEYGRLLAAEGRQLLAATENGRLLAAVQESHRLLAEEGRILLAAVHESHRLLAEEEEHLVCRRFSDCCRVYGRKTLMLRPCVYQEPARRRGMRWLLFSGPFCASSRWMLWQGN
jgi:hypothetical protein